MNDEDVFLRELDPNHLERDPMVVRAEEDDQIFLSRLLRVERAGALIDHMASAHLGNPMPSGGSGEVERHIAIRLCRTEVRTSMAGPAIFSATAYRPLTDASQRFEQLIGVLALEH